MNRKLTRFTAAAWCMLALAGAYPLTQAATDATRGRVLALAGYGYLGLEAPRDGAQLPLLDAGDEA